MKNIYYLCTWKFGLKTMNMKGLKKYIAKHGRHFTRQLATDAILNKWSVSEVEKTSESIVYYNVTRATVGDIVFLTNYYFYTLPRATKRQCVKQALRIIGNVDCADYAFNLWLTLNVNHNLSDYI